MPANDESLNAPGKIVVIMGKHPGKNPFIVGVWTSDQAPTYDEAQNAVECCTGASVTIYKPIDLNVPLAECLNFEGMEYLPVDKMAQSE